MNLTGQPKFTTYFYYYFSFCFECRQTKEKCMSDKKKKRQGKEHSDALFIFYYYYFDRESKKMTREQQNPHSLKLVFEIVAFVPNISSMCAVCRVPSAIVTFTCKVYSIFTCCFLFLFLLIAVPFVRTMPNDNHMGKKSTEYHWVSIEHYAHTPYTIFYIYYVECKFFPTFECIVNLYEYFESQRYWRLQTYRHSLYFTLYISKHVSNHFWNVWFVRFCFIFLHSLYIILCCRLSMHVGILFGRNSVFSFVATYVWHCCPFGIIPCCCVFCRIVCFQFQFIYFFFFFSKIKIFTKSRIYFFLDHFTVSRPKYFECCVILSINLKSLGHICSVFPFLFFFFFWI